MSGILDQGLTDIRNALRDSLITHVGVTDDAAAWAADQTRLNPTQGATANLIKAATKTVVDFRTVDYTIQIDGSTEFTGKTIWAIGVLKSAAATGALSRSVRTQGIGVQAEDSFTVGVRKREQRPAA